MENRISYSTTNDSLSKLINFDKGGNVNYLKQYFKDLLSTLREDDPIVDSIARIYEYEQFRLKYDHTLRDGYVGKLNNSISCLYNATKTRLYPYLPKPKTDYNPQKLRSYKDPNITGESGKSSAHNGTTFTIESVGRNTRAIIYGGLVLRDKSPGSDTITFPFQPSKGLFDHSFSSDWLK